MLSAAILLLAAAVAWLLVVRPLFLPADDPAKVKEETFPLTLVDDEGASMTLANKPARIISLAPYITETLFAIGAGDSIIAVGAGETYPPEATAIPPLVEPDGFTPSATSILAAKPDLVLTSGFTKAPWKDQVRASVPVFTLEATSVDDALSDIAKVGALSGRAVTAKALVTRMRKGLPDLAKTDGKTVMIETLEDPLQVAGSGGYLEDLVARAGGKLVAPSGGQSVPTTPAGIAGTNPHLYVVPASAGSKEQVAARRGFGAIPAFTQGRILVIDDALLFRPGPRLATAIRTLDREMSSR